MADGLNITTLRRILSQPKPLVPCKINAWKNSRGRWPEFRHDSITVWEDFNLDNLNESYSHVLDVRIPEQTLAVPKPHQVLDAVEITEHDDIKQLIRWNCDVIRPTLDFARAHLNLHNGVYLHHKITDPDNSAIARINDGRKPVKVDHLIALDEYPLSNLVIGLGRPSSKFRGRRLADHPGNSANWNVRPLRQLANLCKIAKTRYGYIQTDQDLVACCFSHNGLGHWNVALMPVPWSKHGENQLTTDLALWWLAMLAMSAPQHRKIVRKEEIIRINEWEVPYFHDERGWVRRHKYSNLEARADPPPPPAYRSPSPDNVNGLAAAFAAQVGINADPSFNLDPAGDANFHDFDVDAFLNSVGLGNPGDVNFTNPADANTTDPGEG
ncbi:hypothetical protein F4779DRAFT_59627 [Xylariaceae sp. FL0662B]|nr:hypothetical protein F4779DRAFT_59627 [Xylariaceae sp. FL0662B]